MNAFIYVGGQVFPDALTERPEEGDLIIAADSGYQNALALGVTPTVLLGDFDSMEKPKDFAGELFEFPKEKDDTDAQLAVDLALERGAKQITIVGGLSGRLDHTLSCLGILEMLEEKHVYTTLTDGKNRVHFLKDNSTLVGRGGFTYLSVIAVSEKLKGVTLEGGKYPMKNVTLYRKKQYAISNELTGNCAFIDVRKGSALIIESKD